MEIVLKTSTIDATYRVSSHQLCSGSPVFRAMLGPQSSFSEADILRRQQASNALEPNSSLFQIIAQEEHDPTALTTVLYVLHGRSTHIPESISFENLLEIAIICDYYDCAATMRPWSEIWMKPLRTLSSKSGYEDWLFISWVFRDQDIFGQMTQRFSRNAVMVDGEFGVIVDGEVEKLDYHLPQGIIDAMANKRAEIEQKIIQACRDVLTKYDDDSTIQCSYSQKECDYIAFAGLRRGFRSKNL
ncbi:hypothetical protein BDD12DRAFT_926372, partial [Trichophaea hybrida]